MPTGTFHRSECSDCIIPTNNQSTVLERVASNGMIYAVATCDVSGYCKCIRPYVADETCHHVATKYGNMSQLAFLLSAYCVWLPVYLFFAFGTAYLLTDKCTAPRPLPKSSRSRYNKRKNTRKKTCFFLCQCNGAILIISLILVGILLRGISLFVDPLNMFHRLPGNIFDLLQQIGTSCWLMSGLFTVQCFVQSTQVALKLRGAMKGAWKLKYATFGGAIALTMWGLTDVVFRFIPEFSDVFAFMNAYRVLIDGTTCLVLMILAMIWGHRAVKLLSHNQRFFQSKASIIAESGGNKSGCWRGNVDGNNRSNGSNGSGGGGQTTFQETTKIRKYASSWKRKVKITRSRRTRRQQVVNTWIVHLKGVAIFVFLLFVTIILYSLVGLGSVDAKVSLFPSPPSLNVSYCLKMLLIHSFFPFLSHTLHLIY
jgi:hypothetical protein